MSQAKLPERASLEYLKKLAKDRLKELRRKDSGAKLAGAQLDVAREHGFSSWRALKAEIDKRRPDSAAFFTACANGDVEALGKLLADDPGLARISNPEGDYAGWTGLHTAAQSGNLEAVKLLLRHGADPNAREAGDNTYPLHWAAANRHLGIVRALLDAGGDPHGIGDVHELDAIGWATFYHEHGGAHGDKPQVAELLVERGARHHIFSALSLADEDLIRSVVKQDPQALKRRTSRWEGSQTALHFAMSLKRYDLLDLLIELGANLELEDQNGHTALAWAMMHGDREGIRRLHAAGARASKGWDIAPAKTRRASSPDFTKSVAGMGVSVKGLSPMIGVPDVNRTLEWYTWLGFKELGRFPEKGQADWGLLAFGGAQLMLRPQRQLRDRRDVTLWFYTREVEKLYELFKSRQIQAAQAVLAGAPEAPHTIELETDIWDPPYGGREFGIRDLNGYILYFRRG